jgi:ornithine cyclodeaminase/alanine dehydrogenase-like protein (mu-crystallin family)
MTILLTNEEVDRLLTMRDCIEVMEVAYRELGEGVGLTRPASQLFTPTPHSKDALYSLKSMDGVAPFAGVAALRLSSEILTWPKDASGHTRKIRIGAAPNGRFIGLVLLFSTTTGEPLAIFPDGVIQRMRVGAATGVAAKYLARENATDAAMLGCGWQAAAQVMAILEARPGIETIRCYGPNAERRAAFAQEMQAKTGVAVIASASAEEAARGADVVLCATNSTSPVFNAAWIEPGVHLNSIQHAELDPDVLNRVDVAVTHYNVGGPALTGASKGITHAEKTEGVRQKMRDAVRKRGLPNLHDLVLGHALGRTSPTQVTCFLNHAGLGYQFAAIGSVVYRKAHEQGIGRDLPTDWFTEDVNP